MNTENRLKKILETGDVSLIERVMNEMSEEELLDAQKDIWNDPVENVSSNDLDDAFESFLSRTGNLRQRKIWHIVAHAVAAAIALVMGFFLGGRYFTPEPEIISVQWAECSTSYGESREVLLPDGTRIMLNAGSHLLYPINLVGQTRDVFLSGEAYLEVASDTLRPFFVHAGNAHVRVTGTRFNVKAYSDDDVMTTTLIEGGVEVTVPGQESAIILTPGKALSYNRSTDEIVSYNVRADMYPAWFKGDFDAYHMSLGQIANALERRFNVHIYINRPELSDMMFYASFVNEEGVDQILEAMNFGKSFKIKKEDNLYYIY